MGNLQNYTSEELQKCPYHSQMNTAAKNGKSGEDANTGDWNEEREDEAGTDPDRNEQGGNDNSGGSGSSGSAATNS
ncbi:hypothetical protein IR010_01420 [Flavobacterium sp. MR2016-29]|uniref:hypothetical protein n=1 Tax=Flavobacterium sp. MR2016-29 TaxID=2783795 RepID=UPI00188B9B0D|nr:hypothetical protein [Flavobacterium sp. MR2016-29]MBF4491182.1 hypothetical protein [Flavobacterium sp. MR2016-29]